MPTRCGAARCHQRQQHQQLNTCTEFVQIIASSRRSPPKQQWQCGPACMGLFLRKPHDISHHQGHIDDVQVSYPVGTAAAPTAATGSRSHTLPCHTHHQRRGVVAPRHLHQQASVHMHRKRLCTYTHTHIRAHTRVAADAPGTVL